MSKGVLGGKRATVVHELTRDITNGRLRAGDQLAGENELAKRFNVSRGTIRQALDDLKQQQLITTHTGVGSFVTYDGQPLEQSQGWAKALVDAGSTVTVEVIGIEPVDEIPVAGIDGPGIRIHRVRRDAQGAGVSYEVALIPATGTLAFLPETGLLDGSLTKSLAAEGLVAAAGTQKVTVARLDAHAAQVLGRAEGEPFLDSERTSITVDGCFVEHVTSLLDPDHFRLSLTFGDNQ